MKSNEFRELAKDVLPVIGDFERLLEEHGVEGSVGIIVSADGYFAFNQYESDFKMQRMSKKSPITIHLKEVVQWSTNSET